MKLDVSIEILLSTPYHIALNGDISKLVFGSDICFLLSNLPLIVHVSLLEPKFLCEFSIEARTNSPESRSMWRIPNFELCPML